MTREEAAQTIYGLIIRSDESEEGCYIYSDEIKALNMAIEALKQPERKKGKWILSDEQWQEDVNNGNYRFICSECGKSDIHSKAVIVSFCWNCGAEMGE